MTRKAKMILMNWAQAVERMMVGGVMRRQSDKRGDFQDITMIGPLWDEEQFGYWFASFPGLQMFVPDNVCLRATDWYEIASLTKEHIRHKREICKEFAMGDLIEGDGSWPEWPEVADEAESQQDDLSAAASQHPAASPGSTSAAR